MAHAEKMRAQRAIWDAEEAALAAGAGAADNLQARELAIIEAGTDAVNRGMASPLNWGLVIVGLALMPFTGGLSFGLTLLGGLRMGPPKHAVQAAIPRTVDAVAPRAGCTRVLAALGGLIFMLFALALFALLVVYQAGLLGGVK